jgi:hypothetical protein
VGLSLRQRRPTVETVAAFLDDMVRRLVPGVDAAAVRTTFARAAAGYTVPRTDDGRRASAITPSGVPFEASVTGGGGRLDGALRYVTETATGMPFFGPRLAAQRLALDGLVERLAPEARGEAAGLGCLLDALFPDPSVVPSRTRFATWFGLVHRSDAPGHLAGLKVYGNAGHDEGGLGRLATRWPVLGELVDLVDGLPFLVPHVAAAEAGTGGGVHKLYFRTDRRTDGASLAVVARRFGACAGDLLDELAACGASLGWRSGVHLCCERRAGGDPTLSVHLPAKALRLDPAGMLALARTLAARHHGTTRGVDALAGAAHAAGGAWEVSVVGIGLVPGGGLGKLNVYLAAGAS